MKFPRQTIAALAVALAAALPGTAGAETMDEYVLTHGDELHIYVYGQSDLSSRRDSSDTAFLVRPDGTLSFPLVGELAVEGKTVREFTEELTDRLSEYLRHPQVTVNLVRLGGTRVFVLGEVRNPGMFTLSRSHRLLDAVGAAGGFTQYAAKKNVFLIRDGREDRVEKLNFNDYLRKGDRSQNVELHEGDCLYFTSNNKIDFSKDIMPWVYGWYYVDRAVKDR
ncbi:MAG: polysaccharide export protein [Schwartzia sp.]|nr:polysaccharide export protein [Schwartzia sp. (in: firmicutes)]